MIKPKLTYSYELNTWFCKHPDTDIVSGSTPQQAYQKWRICYDRKNFLEKANIKEIWPGYTYA